MTRNSPPTPWRRRGDFRGRIEQSANIAPSLRQTAENRHGGPSLSRPRDDIIVADMTLEVQLTESEALALQQKADSMGQDLSAYAAELLRRDAARPIRSIEQIAQDIEKRRDEPLNMSEDDIGEMLETTKHAMRAERRQRAAQ
jgi:hypothetical protein